MQRLSFLRHTCLTALLAWMVVAGLSCRSSQPARETEEETPSTQDLESALSLLYTRENGELLLSSPRRDSTKMLASEASFGGARAASPSGRYLAFSYATTDSSHLALLDLTAPVSLQTLHADASPVTYSLAWHPAQARLAFGYYRPSSNGVRGPGGLRIATPDGSTRNVGCRAAREVLHWFSDGSLAARDDEQLYVVASSDCATLASRDARRMHHVTYAPTGQRMAFIHRELHYDRSAHEYVPDSSLVLSAPRSEESETLFGDDRAVRHLRWAPDGSELAFSMEVDTSRHRQIVIHDGSRTFYAVPPDEVTADQAHPRWAPDGGRLAFTLRTAHGPVAATRVKGQTRRLGPVEQAVWGWLDDRTVVLPGPDSLRVRTVGGRTRYARRAPATLIHVWRRPLP